MKFTISNKIPTKLTEAYEKVILYLFHLIPMSEMDIESVIAEDAMIYGTTVDENIFGIEDFKSTMQMQAKELEGLEPHFERIQFFNIFLITLKQACSSRK